MNSKVKNENIVFWAVMCLTAVLLWLVVNSKQLDHHLQISFRKFASQDGSRSVKKMMIVGNQVTGLLRNCKKFTFATSLKRGDIFAARQAENFSIIVKGNPWAVGLMWLSRVILPFIILVAFWIYLRRRAHSSGEEVLPFVKRQVRLRWSSGLMDDGNLRPDLPHLVRFLECPKWAGSVTSRSLPEGPTSAAVACIGDLPANVSVQRHMREIIGYLVNVHGFRHVFVEGASGPGDLQLLASLPPLVRWAFMEMLLKRAYLTGSEYAGASRPGWDFELSGVDDPDLFRNNFRSAEGIEVVRDQVLQAANVFRQRIIRACTPIVSSELSDFLLTLERRRADRLATPTSEHLRYLLLYTGSYAITIPSGLRQLLPDFGGDHLSTERAASSSVLSSLQFEADILAVENAISEAICRMSGNPADSPYSLLLNTVDLAARAFQLGLQNEEARSFFTFEAQGLEGRITAAVDKVNGLLEPTDEKLEMPDEFGIVFSKWDLPETFYRTALARSDAMLTNVASQIKQRGIDRAIFVSGGFHSAYVASQLAHRHGIAGVIIMPNVDKLDQEPAYRRRLLEELRSEPTPAGTRDFTAKMAAVGTSVQNAASRWLTGAYRAYVFSKIQDFVLSSTILRGSETVLELECYYTNIVPALSKRLQSGIVMGIDQFDYFMAGNEINLLNPQPYLNRVLRVAESANSQILNMNPRFLYFKNGSLDLIVSLNLDRIQRAADRREVLEEAVRSLNVGGIVLLLAGRRCNEYARTLLKLNMNEVTRIEPLRYIRRSRLVAARKAGTGKLEDRIALAGVPRLVAMPDKKGRVVWNRL